MVKKCNVILNNDAVTVINFDGIEVQIPSIHREAKTLNILYRNNKYIVVDDDYKEGLIAEPVIEKVETKAKVSKRKTTKQKSVE